MPAAPTLVSLGLGCAAAMALRLHGLRGAAMPLDWVRATPSGLVECLRDDFARMLAAPRRVDFRACAAEPFVPQIQDAYGFTYRHDFPTEVGVLRADRDAAPEEGPFFAKAPCRADWEAALPAVLAKYARRVARFRAACAAEGARVVFVVCDAPGAPVRLTTEALGQAAAILHARYPALRFAFLALGCAALPQRKEDGPRGAIWTARMGSVWTVGASSPEAAPTREAFRDALARAAAWP